MIRRRLYYGNLLLRMVMICLPILAFAIAGFLRYCTIFPHSEIRPSSWRPYWILLICTWAFWAVASRKLDLCLYEKLFATRGKTQRLMVACGLTYAPIITGLFFYRAFNFSRLFIVLSALSLVFLAWLTQVGFRLLLESRRKYWIPVCHILLVGTDEFAAGVAKQLGENKFMPCKVVGAVRLPGQENALAGITIHGLEDIRQLANDKGFDDVIIALPPSRFSEIPLLKSKFEALSVPIRAVLDFGKSVTFSESLFAFGSTMMLDLERTPAESAEYLSLKRSFDILFSAFALILTSPLILLIAVLIRLTSPGSVFFVQERVGLNGRLFKMYKFRSMISLNDSSDSRWTVPNDRRCTWLGTFLRRTSLDELPQFWNVLRGEMSVVGPRPERPYFVEKFLQEIDLYNRRHYLKVGITGWAQVNGLRGDTSIKERVEFDLYYMRNWSFAFDLHIILLTFLRGFSDDNAY